MRGECTSYSDSELLSKLQGTVEVRGSSDAWQPLPGFPASTQAKCSPSSLISAFVQEQLFEPCHGERAGGNGEDKCPSQAIAVFAASSDDSNCNWMDYLELAIVNMLAVVCACAAAGAAWFQISVRHLLNKASVIAAVSGWILFAGLGDRAETAQGTPSALPPFLSLLLLFPGPLMLDAFALEASFGVTCVWLIAVTTIHPQSDDTSRALGGWHALRIMTTSIVAAMCTTALSLLLLRWRLHVSTLEAARGDRQAFEGAWRAFQEAAGAEFDAKIERVERALAGVAAAQSLDGVSRHARVCGL